MEIIQKFIYAYLATFVHDRAITLLAITDVFLKTNCFLLNFQCFFLLSYIDLTWCSAQQIQYYHIYCFKIRLRCKYIVLLEYKLVLLLTVCANFYETSLMNLTALRTNQKPAKLAQYQWASHSSLNGEKQTESLFVFVISPAAHDDRNVSQTLWLTKDRSTPRSQGNWSIVGNGFPVAILNTPGHLSPCVVFS